MFHPGIASIFQLGIIIAIELDKVDSFFEMTELGCLLDPRKINSFNSDICQVGRHMIIIKDGVLYLYLFESSFQPKASF